MRRNLVSRWLSGLLFLFLFCSGGTAAAASLSWGGVWHATSATGAESDYLDAGFNLNNVSSFGSMTATVKGPNDFSYTFTDADIHPFVNGQFAVYKSFTSLQTGTYTFTFDDGAGNTSCRVDTHGDIRALPVVDSATIQLIRKADGSYRASWAPLNAAATYWYRIRVQTGSGLPVYVSSRDMSSIVDIPASALVNGTAYQVRVEALEAPTMDLQGNRSNSAFVSFTPQASDYLPGRSIIGCASANNRIDPGNLTSAEFILCVSDPSAVTSIEVNGPQSFTDTFDLNVDKVVSNGTTTFWKQLSTVPATGVYRLHVLANGIDSYAYATLTQPASNPAADPATFQAEDAGNGNMRFSWGDVDHTGALFYRVQVRDTVTGTFTSTNRVNATHIDIPIAAMGDLTNKVWRVEVMDSASGNTQRNRINSPYTTAPLTYLSFDAGRPVIGGYGLCHVNTAGGPATELWMDADDSDGTITELRVEGPESFSRNLLTEGKLRDNAYHLSESGSLAAGLYTFTARDNAGKTSVRYAYLGSPHQIPRVDYRTIQLNSEANGDIRISWAPVASDVPLWYMIHLFDITTGEQLATPVLANGPIPGSPVQPLTSYPIPAASVTMGTIFRIVALDGSDSTTMNNASISTMVAFESAGFAYSGIADSDGDGYAVDADPNDNNSQVTPFSIQGGGTYQASGTYYYSAPNQTLTFTWTASNFVCEGPNIGVEEKTISLSATSFSWMNDGDPMVWTRSGAGEGVVGTWTSSNSSSGNSWTLILGSDGTLSVTGAIVSCSGGGTGITYTGAVTDRSGVPIAGVAVQVPEDPSRTATTDANGIFSLSGISAGTPFSLQLSKGGYLPAYSARITTSADMDTTGRPVMLFPTDQFSIWGVPTGKGVIRTRVVDTTDPDNAYIAGVTLTAVNSADTSVSYPVSYPNQGPTGSSTSASGGYMVSDIPDGVTVKVTAARGGWTFAERYYTVHADAVSQGRVIGTQSSTPAISFGGMVKDGGGTVVSGATVNVVNSSTFTTTSTADGYFWLEGMSPSAPLALRISKTGFLPAYSNNMTLQGPVFSAGRAFALYPAAAVSSWGVTPGTAVIRTRVVDAADPDDGYLQGVTVTAVNDANPATSYPVTYFDGTSHGGNSTYSNGIFLVRNLPDGVTVRVTAAKSGWTFATVRYTVHADSVSQGRIRGQQAAAGTPSIAVTPSSLSFGSVAAGGSSVKTLTFSNAGTGELTVSSATSTGDAVFTAEPGGANPCPDLPATFAPGVSCTLTVTFAPDAVGGFAGALEVESDDPATPLLTISFSGSGTAAGAPKISASSLSLSFGSLAVDATSDPKTLTFTNTGTADLHFTSHEVTGDDGYLFTVEPSETGGCGELLAAGAKCSVTVTFTPAAAGEASASLVVETDAANSPTLTISLTGSGFTPPVIDSLSSYSGTEGDQVVIDGSSFGTTGKVAFVPDAAPEGTKGTAARIVGTYSDTQITVAVPRLLAGTYRVEVRNSRGSAAAPELFEVNAPLISECATEGTEGDVITVSGEFFGTKATVGFTASGSTKRVAAKMVSSAENSISVRVPRLLQGEYGITVRNSQGMSEAWPFQVRPPAVADWGNTAGTEGDQVSVSGDFLGPKGSVRFVSDTTGRTVAAKVSSYNLEGSGEIVYTVPKLSAGVYTLAVKNNQGSDDSGSFEVMLPDPATLSSSEAATGTAVTVSGDYFGKKAKVSLLTQAGKSIAAKTLSSAEGEVTFTVPKVTPGEYAVVVTTSAGKAAEGNRPQLTVTVP